MAQATEAKTMGDGFMASCIAVKSGAEETPGVRQIAEPERR